MDNYFKIFDLDISFDIDLEVLENKYFKLLKKYHPDSNIDKNEKEKLACLNQTILINDAYKTLVNPSLKIFYLLKLNNIDLDAESNIISNDFLNEIFQYRIDASELIGQDLNNLENDVVQRINLSIQEFRNTYIDKSDVAITEAIKIKYYYKILEEIKINK